MSRFRYSPTPSTDTLPQQPSNPAPPSSNLILPEPLKNVNFDINLFGSFAGPIPNNSPQNANININTNINTSTNNNNNNSTPNLRLILGNRVNIPPSQK